MTSWLMLSDLREHLLEVINHLGIFEKFISKLIVSAVPADGLAYVYICKCSDEHVHDSTVWDQYLKS